MNKCSKAREVMGAYIYGELPPDEMKKVRIHLEECTACHEEMKSQSVAVGRIPTESPELSGIDKERIFWSVQGGIHRSAKPGLMSSPVWRALYGLGATGAVASLLIVGIIIGYNYTARPGQVDSSPTPTSIDEPFPTDTPLSSEPPAVESRAPVSPPSYVAPKPEPPPSPAPSGKAAGFVRSNEQLPNRQGAHAKKRIQHQPQIAEENPDDVQQNHVETDSDNQAEPQSSGDSKPEADMPSATTAPAPTGWDDVRETPPSEGETSSR